MKRWIGAGLLAATLMVTGCASNGYYGRNYRYDRDYRNRNYRDWTAIATTTGIIATTAITGASGR